jgi:predicted component of type VI protein secretion system
MPRLILKSDSRVLKDHVVGAMSTIGRRPDNTIVVEDAAVSGHHACVFRDGDDLVVEDLESTNGTFVNDKRVTRQRLRRGDVIAIGKHTLLVERVSGDAPAGDDAAKGLMSNPSDTIFLDAKKHQALLAMLKDADVLAPLSGGSPARIGVLRVIGGETTPSEYRLEAHTSLIGRADTALVRLHGWFKPRVAVAIARNADGYVATLMGGKTLINSQPLDGRCKLKDGDVLQVNGLTMEFHLSG